jgi:hypothetical protein
LRARSVTTPGTSRPPSSQPTSTRSLRPGTRRDYAEPIQFFSRKYLTEGLRDLIERAVRRLAGDQNAWSSATTSPAEPSTTSSGAQSLTEAVKGTPSVLLASGSSSRPTADALASISAAARGFVEMYRRYADEFPRGARDASYEDAGRAHRRDEPGQPLRSEFGAEEGCSLPGPRPQLMLRRPRAGARRRTGG